MQDEESLVRRAQEQDQAALTGIYEANFDRIYRYIALKIGDRTEAEDMTQQVFLSAFKSISSYKHRGTPFSAWLFRIAHNQVVDYLRKKSKRATVPLEKVPERGGGDPRLEVEQSLTMEELASATSKLTPAQREVLSLRFAGGLSVAQVAKVMGKSEGAIKALQHSAIVSLRKILAAG
ncbi:MAG TPA: sigma-70 family RNA polymerase sigma factor [Dehalococcoidia bacterium]|nr:sigma-70 family RNA polymerase sigma factor [Dehalococcoidia bacterium]